jgi:serine/threonine protein kinase
MNAAQQQHPSPAQLLAFAHGRLRAGDFAAIEEHLASCDRCCEWISQQPDNTLVALAREAATLGFQAAKAPSSQDANEIPAGLKNHPRYRVIESIGVGGMGSVYKAEHRMMQRLVALKIIHPRLLANREAVERFHREMRVAAKLAHPNIVVSYDADQAGDLHFLVMEYVQGESLDERIAKQGPASVTEACDWIRQAALGLQHAHEQGMVHRDIKPHNLMLTTDGQVKILDFGLTRVVGDQAAEGGSSGSDSQANVATRADTILGTPDYIAPEQIASASAADIRSDIYSLGCTLYFLLTGRAPFSEGSVIARLHAHEQSAFPQLELTRTDVPPALTRVLARMTAKRREDRYATPAEVARDLAAIAVNTPRPPTPATTATASPMARRALLGIGGGIAGLIVLLAGYNMFAPGGGSSSSDKTRLLVLLPSQGLWFPDYQSLVDAAANADVQLTFAGTRTEPAQLMPSSPPGEAQANVKLDSSVRADDFDGIVFIGFETAEFSPGGPAASQVQRLLKAFGQERKVIASLCAGQRALAQLGLLQGKRVASCQYVKPDIIVSGGGEPSPHTVETDGRVVTAADAKDAPALLEAIKKSLGR